MADRPDTYALARIDLTGASTHGWQVRLQRRGVKYAKFFADSLHGGAQASFEKARAWRDTLLHSLAEDSARVCRPSVRNRSGVVGVSKVTVLGPNGVEYVFWQATWSPVPGQRRTVKFSVRRHGDRVAFSLAVEARERGVRR